MVLGIPEFEIREFPGFVARQNSSERVDHDCEPTPSAHARLGAVGKVVGQNE